MTVKSKNKKILIIDDEQSALFLEKAILSAAGYEVVTESNSQKAMQTIKEQMPDLILMDIVMPDINGIELASLIKKDSKLKKIHLIAITGMPMLNEKNRKNFEQIVIKPFHMQDLIKDLDKLFGL